MECKNPNKQNLEIFRKSTKQYELLFTEDGRPIDITGWTVYFTAKLQMSDTDANAKIRVTVTEHCEAKAGKTLIVLTSEDTDIDSTNYYYSIDFKDTTDNEGVLVSGRLKICEPVLNNR